MANLYTCLTCQVAFTTPDKQRSHYRTEWHKYNLKRKVAELAPLSAEQFANKIFVQKARNQREAETINLIFECSACHKCYSTENAFTNHLQSKKHQRMELVAAQSDPSSISDDDQAATLQPSKTRQNDATNCLFCNEMFPNLEENLVHMKLAHSFFLPDIDYLVDTKGLIMYLDNKIQTHKQCLYCNGRGRLWNTSEAVRDHMKAKGHCKMAYDDSEDPEALLKFYEFGPLSDLPAVWGETQVVLENGLRISSRRLLHHYLRKLTKPNTAVATSDAMATAEEVTIPVPKNRKERRHPHLMLTDGNMITLGATQTSHRSLNQHIAAQCHASKEENRNNKIFALRFRPQVPI